MILIDWDSDSAVRLRENKNKWFTILSYFGRLQSKIEENMKIIVYLGSISAALSRPRGISRNSSW